MGRETENNSARSLIAYSQIRPGYSTLRELYCTRDPSTYKKYLIQPAGQIALDLITQEKSNLDRIVATLELKEMSQGTLIRKLCMYTITNPTRQAVFKYDRLIRSSYTPKYLREPQLERNIRYFQNRIESYHQLRVAVAKVGEKVTTGALRL